MKQLIAAIVFLGLSCFAFAENIQSREFYFDIGARVCTGNKCQINDIESGSGRIELQEVKPGIFQGEIDFKYDLYGLEFLSKIQVSQFYFRGREQTNFYLTMLANGNAEPIGSTEVITVNDEKLNSVAAYGACQAARGKEVCPFILIGPRYEY